MAKIRRSKCTWAEKVGDIIGSET